MRDLAGAQAVAAVELTALTKLYKDVCAVSALSLTVRSGEIFGLLGRNGAGKSTTLDMVCGLLRPTSGHARVCGADMALTRQAKRLIGYVPQDNTAYLPLSVLHNVCFAAQLRGISRADAHERGAAVLQRVGLAPLHGRLAAKLSGGERRRLSLAMALVHHPSVLVLDEPTAGVDVDSRRLIFELLRELREEGITILYTTHYLEEAEALCDRVAIIDLGELVICGSVAHVIARYGSSSLEIRDEPPHRVRATLTELFPHAEITPEEDAVRVELVDDAMLREMCSALLASGVAFESLRIVRRSLESAFLEATA